jgi:enediyne biosynthesis protein E4
MAGSNLGMLTRAFVGWGGSFLDFDNDGDLDLVVANGDALFLLGSEPLLLENRGDGSFVDAGKRGGACFSAKLRARGSAVCDFDNDGRMDIVLTAIGDRPLLLRNQDPSGGHWLTLDLEGTRSNRDGFGALIKVVAGGRTYVSQARSAFGFLMQSDRRVHFGLGKATEVERIEIRWPSGTLQSLSGIRADHIVKIREPGERALAREGPVSRFLTVSYPFYFSFGKP